MPSDERSNVVRKKHSMILEDRKTLTFTGIKDVSGLEDQKVELSTELGELTIKGNGLHINGFSSDTGELELEGEIDSLVYSESRKPEGGFFSKLFR